ncbi:hypothetical protein Pan1_98 [Pseudanabaena phage Pan1]|nr:hypothetical protein Pan1_98 [Pseudanabaena phage Pan1]
MSDFVTGALGAIAVVALLFFLVILTTLMGAVAGWAVGLFFEQTILSTLARFGVNVAGLTMWQLGATLAFVGSFFKAATTVKAK